MSAIYYDSCGHRGYIFDPSDSSWTKIGATRLNDSMVIIGRDTINISGAGGGGADNSIATGSRTATGDYIQDWAQHWFYLNNLKSLNFNSNRIDPNYPGNHKTFSFYSDSTASTYPLWLRWSLRNVANNQDSVGADLTFGTDYFQFSNYNSANYADLYASGNLYYPSIQMLVGDGAGNQSNINVGSTIVNIYAQDSVRMKLVPATTADSIVALRSLGFGLNTLVKIPASAIGGGGSATLSNQGSGFRLVKTSGGQIKTLFGGFGITPDSSTNTNAITFKADTSSTNHLVTHSALKDTAAAIRAAAGGGTPGGSTTQIQFNNSGAFAGDAGLTYNSTTNKITTDSIRSIKNTPDTVLIGTFQGDNLNDSAYFFGTSITFGVASTDPENSYIYQVARGLRVKPVNGGFSGYLLQKSPGWPLTNTFMDVYMSAIPVKTPNRKYIFFAWGENDITNDYAYHSLFGVDTSYFKRDYVNAINLAVSRGWSLSDIRIISPFYQLETGAPFTLQQNYFDAAKHIADSLSIPFIDVLHQGKNYGTKILDDAIHPSNYGHAFHAHNILSQLSQPLQIRAGENFVNAGTSVFNKVYHFGNDTATVGYQLGAFNNGGLMVKVPAERFAMITNNNVPAQSGSLAVKGNITSGKCLRAEGDNGFGSGDGDGLQIEFTGGDGILRPFSWSTSSAGKVYLPQSPLVVNIDRVAMPSPFSTMYVNGSSAAKGIYSFGNGNVLYNQNTNEPALNMLVNADSVGRIVTYAVSGYRPTAINGIGGKPVLISTETDNGSGAKLQVDGRVSISTIDSSSTPANILYQEPGTGLIKKAAVPSGGSAGSWTPTLTADVNVDGTPTTLHSTYTRTGNIVTCYVTISVDPTANSTQTEVGITLPVASNFTDSNDLSGTGSGSAGNGAATFVLANANTTSDRATLIFQSGSTSASIVTLTFQYTVQ